MSRQRSREIIFRIDKDDERRQRIWAERFREERDRANLSVEDVANRCGISTRNLYNYLNAATPLNLAHLRPLALAVGASVLEWAQIFGLVDAELLLAGHEVERLRDRVRRAEVQIGELNAAGSGVGLIAKAALQSGVWVMGASPLLEGPVQCRLRVGDLVTIRRHDGGPCTAEDIRVDPHAGPALTKASAVRQPGAVFIKDHSPGADPTTDLRSEWVWIVPRLNILRAHDPVPCNTTARSIFILSSSLTGAWATDVASLVGLGLGFGTSTTSAVVRYTQGEQMRDDPARQGGGTISRARAYVAADFLADPIKRADLTVWAHGTSGPSEPLVQRLANPEHGLLVVYLRPTDRLHEYLGARIRANNDIQKLVDRRSELDDALSSLPITNLLIDAGFPSDIDPKGPLSGEVRDAFLERSILIALRILQHVHTEMSGPSLRELHSNAPDTFRTLASRFADDIPKLTSNAGLAKDRAFD